MGHFDFLPWQAHLVPANLNVRVGFVIQGTPQIYHTASFRHCRHLPRRRFDYTSLSLTIRRANLQA